jgi:hypothetical protein
MPRTEIPERYVAEFRQQTSTALAKLDLTSGRQGEAQLAQR